MKIPLARSPVSRETQRHKALSAQQGSKSEAARHRQHRGHVGNHSHDTPFGQPEMIRTVAPFREAPLPPHELAEKGSKRHTPDGPYARVAMHWQDIIPFLEAESAPYCNSLLSIPAEPLRKTPLPDQPEHFFLDRPGNVQVFVHPQEIVLLRYSVRHAGYWPLPRIAVRIVRSRILKSMRRLTFSM